MSLVGAMLDGGHGWWADARRHLTFHNEVGMEIHQEPGVLQVAE